MKRTLVFHYKHHKKTIQTLWVYYNSRIDVNKKTLYDILTYNKIFNEDQPYNKNLERIMLLDPAKSDNMGLQKSG